MGPWKVLLAILSILSLALIAAGEVNQRAEVEGGNVIEIAIVQSASNSGNGTINQDVFVSASNNSQVIYQEYQEADLGLGWEDADGNVSLEGLNMIKIILEQEAENTGSGDINNAIVVVVEDNEQYLVQEVDLYFIEVV